MFGLNMTFISSHEVKNVYFMSGEATLYNLYSFFFDRT